MASVANLLDLPLAVVSGSVALGFGAPFFAAAQAELDRSCRLDFSRGTRIVPGGLGADGPIIGAAARFACSGTASVQQPLSSARRSLPLSMTTVPSWVTVWKMRAVAVVPHAHGEHVAGHHRLAEARVHAPERAGSEPQNACSNARPVTP